MSETRAVIFYVKNFTKVRINGQTLKIYEQTVFTCTCLKHVITPIIFYVKNSTRVVLENIVTLNYVLKK